MKKVLISLLLTLIIASGVNAIGSGIIIPQPYKNVTPEVEYVKGTTIYAVGFETQPPIIVEFGEDTADWMRYEVYDVFSYKTYRNQTAWGFKTYLYLTAPKKTLEGTYEGTVTGKVCSGSEGAIGICVGAQAEIVAEVIREDEGNHKGWLK